MSLKNVVLGFCFAAALASLSFAEDFSYRGQFGNGQVQTTDHGREVFRFEKAVAIRAPLTVGVADHENQARIVKLQHRLQRRSAELLGSTRLSTRGDFDVIRVRECGIREVQLKVDGEDAIIDHLIVSFSDHQSQTLDYAKYFGTGVIGAERDLNGNRRCVKNIVVVGMTVDRQRPPNQATVQVYGIR
jgi:hypothetical protein